MNRIIRPARNIQGALRLPGDKSISHRYAMLAAVARGRSRLQNFASGQDCASTLRCLRALGVEIVSAEDGAIEIEGKSSMVAPGRSLDCGNSGSTMRMLAGLLSGKGVACDLIGDGSLTGRPMARVVDPLRKMGAVITTGEQARPPLRLESRAPLRGIHYQPAVASAQVKSSLLFAGLFAQGTTTVKEDVRTRDHGELALRSFGAEVERSQDSVSIAGGQPLEALTAYLPGDISSAAFFLCAAALFPRSDLVLEGIGMNPTRSAILDILTGFGARISILNLEDHHGELMGTVKAQPGDLRGGKIDGAWSARLIDELPLLAAIAPLTTDGIEIRNASELRVKESDRIASTAENLRRMGAHVEEFPDGLRVAGSQPLHGAQLDSFGDHRIGMAFAIAALRATGETHMRNADAVAISFPEFWDYLDRVIVD